MAGSVLITGSEASSDAGAVFRVDRATGAQTIVSSGGSFSTPIGIAVEADGGILVADTDAFGGTGGVIHVDPVTGSHTTLSSGGAFRSPRRVAVVPAIHT